MPIIKRIPKGSPLEFEEMDNNLTELENRIEQRVEKEAGKSLVSDTQLADLEAKKHLQNSDNILAQGTENEVAAAELRAHLDNHGIDSVSGLVEALAGKENEGVAQSLVTALETALKDGVSVDGDTLAKLRALIATLRTDLTAEQGKVSALQTLVASDDLTLDTVQELVNYIKANKSLIDSITLDKVGKTDIVDNLDQETAGKVLDARQGKALKDLIDALPTNGGGATSVLVYNSAAPSSGISYQTPTELMTAFQATQGPVTIYLQTNLELAIQTYDFQGRATLLSYPYVLVSGVGGDIPTIDNLRNTLGVSFTKVDFTFSDGVGSSIESKYGVFTEVVYPSGVYHTLDGCTYYPGMRTNSTSNIYLYPVNYAWLDWQANRFTGAGSASFFIEADASTFYNINALSVKADEFLTQANTMVPTNLSHTGKASNIFYDNSLGIYPPGTDTVQGALDAGTGGGGSSTNGHLMFSTKKERDDYGTADLVKGMTCYIVEGEASYSSGGLVTLVDTSNNPLPADAAVWDYGFQNHVPVQHYLVDKLNAKVYYMKMAYYEGGVDHIRATANLSGELTNCIYENGGFPVLGGVVNATDPAKRDIVYLDNNGGIAAQYPTDLPSISQLAGANNMGAVWVMSRDASVTTVRRFNNSSRAFDLTLNTGSGPCWGALGFQSLLVVNYHSNTYQRFNLQDNTVETVPVGVNPFYFIKTDYYDVVLCEGDNTVHLVNNFYGNKSVQTADKPVSCYYDSNLQLLYVLCENSFDVYRLNTTIELVERFYTAYADRVSQNPARALVGVYGSGVLYADKNGVHQYDAKSNSIVNDVTFYNSETSSYLSVAAIGQFIDKTYALGPANKLGQLDYSYTDYSGEYVWTGSWRRMDSMNRYLDIYDAEQTLLDEDIHLYNGRRFAFTDSNTAQTLTLPFAGDFWNRQPIFHISDETGTASTYTKKIVVNSDGSDRIYGVGLPAAGVTELTLTNYQNVMFSTDGDGKYVVLSGLQAGAVTDADLLNYRTASPRAIHAANSGTVTLNLTSAESRSSLTTNANFTIALSNATDGDIHCLTVQFTAAATYVITLPGNSYKAGASGISTSITVTTTAANETFDIVLNVTSLDGTTLRNHFAISAKY